MPDIYEFDPFGQYPLDELLKVKAPPPPEDFEDFWARAYRHALEVDPQPQVSPTGKKKRHWQIADVRFRSTDQTLLGGWLLLPKSAPPKRAFIVGHGYGGRHEPDFHLPFPDAAILFPCCRGISRSHAPPISEDPKWHVLHDIDKKDHYILRGCVEDLWVSVTMLEMLFPLTRGRIGFLGVSFSGGLGALALAQDQRIAKGHLNVPTFGHHRLRLRIKTHGSGLAVQEFYQRHPQTVSNTLPYYDAANAAEFIKMPMHFALALKDPVVTPPGQFSIYNHVQNHKQLYVLHAGHSEYPEQAKQHKELLRHLKIFFDSV